MYLEISLTWNSILKSRNYWCNIKLIQPQVSLPYFKLKLWSVVSWPLLMYKRVTFWILYYDHFCPQNVLRVWRPYAPIHLPGDMYMCNVAHTHLKIIWTICKCLCAMTCTPMRNEVWLQWYGDSQDIFVSVLLHSHWLPLSIFWLIVWLINPN